MRDFYTSGEASKKLNLSRETMRVYAKKFGVGKMVSGRWFFSEADMLVLERRRKLYPTYIPGESVYKKPRRYVR